jgi:hypothetical protein
MCGWLSRETARASRSKRSRRSGLRITSPLRRRKPRQRLREAGTERFGGPPATINREVHALRRAFNVAARQTAPAESAALRHAADLPRVCKDKPGQPITDFWDVWRNALQAAKVARGAAFPRPQALSSPDADPRGSGRDDGEKSSKRQRGVGSSGRIRTYDPPVNSRMLYR